MAAKVASLALGNNTCSGRMIKPEVCDEESRSLDPMKISAAQITAGPYRQSRFLNVPDSCLTCAAGSESSSIIEGRRVAQEVARN